MLFSLHVSILPYRNLFAILIQRFFRNYVIRRHRAAFVIQKWYIACSYRHGGVAYRRAELQFENSV